jgi:hypothetical protein
VGNHVRWPYEWAPAILDFFRVHPLDARGRSVASPSPCLAAG